MKRLLKLAAGALAAAVIMSSAAVPVYADKVYETQEQAVSALETLSSSFGIDTDGNYTYPDGYAGAYLDDDNCLVVLVSEDAAGQYFRDYLKAYDCVRITKVKYSLNELQAKLEETVKKLPETSYGKKIWWSYYVNEQDNLGIIKIYRSLYDDLSKADQKKVAVATGSNITLYFDDGYPVTVTGKVSLKTKDGVTYGYSGDKKLGRYTGWSKDSKGRRMYYSKGVKLTGWQKISGKYYFFSEKGKALTGKQKISGGTYYFGENGVWTGKLSSKSVKPKDFAVSFAAGYGGSDRKLSTKENKVEKLINEGEYTSAFHKFTGADKQIIWAIISGYGLTEADDSVVYDENYALKIAKENSNYTANIVSSEPCWEYTVTITANGRTYTFRGTEDLFDSRIQDYDATAAGLWKLTDHLEKLLKSTVEYKSFPETNVYYD